MTGPLAGIITQMRIIFMVRLLFLMEDVTITKMKGVLKSES